LRSPGASSPIERRDGAPDGPHLAREREGLECDRIDGAPRFVVRGMCVQALEMERRGHVVELGLLRALVRVIMRSVSVSASRGLVGRCVRLTKLRLVVSTVTQPGPRSHCRDVLVLVFGEKFHFKLIFLKQTNENRARGPRPSTPALLKAKPKGKKHI
jgi:hypothetical protein